MAVIQAGKLIAGKYRLDKPLKGGDMGAVWLAHHMQLDAPVAVKFMHDCLVSDAGARLRFEREAKAAAQIRSPFVVHVYDHGIDDGSPFIVMEYLEGEDLTRRLRHGQKMRFDEAVMICHQVCKGLHRAHRLGIVHRDLKPGNIFLSSPDENMVKLLDFGIAKETGSTRMVKSEATTSGQILGSPQYMSPEQTRGKTLDGRSDLWSLAVILYRPLTGRRPPSPSSRVPPVELVELFVRHRRQRLSEKLGHFFLDLDQPLSTLRTLAPPRGLTFQLADALLQRVPCLRLGTALLRRQAGEPTALSLRTPGADVRGVQALALQQCAQLTKLRACVRHREDPPLVLSREAASCCLGLHLGSGHRGLTVAARICVAHP